jgi:hypothetical protein
MLIKVLPGLDTFYPGQDKKTFELAKTSNIQRITLVDKSKEMKAVKNNRSRGHRLRHKYVTIQMPKKNPNRD